MTTPSQEDLRAILRDYSQGHADTTVVLRALVEHEEWVVPLPIMTSHYRRRVFDTIGIFGKHLSSPPGQFWVCSDLVAAMAGAERGISLGPCAVGVAGTEIFGSLSPDWKEIYVNPGMPVEETFFLRPHPEFGWLNCFKFAEAVKLEKSIDRIGAAHPEELLEMVRSFGELFVMVMADGSLLTLYYEGRSIAALAVFTAPDRIEALTATVADRSLFRDSRIISVVGEQFLPVAEVDYRFMELNPGSDRGTCVLPIGQPGSTGPRG